MTENQMDEIELIADEGAFVTALGLNPGAIKAGTVNIEFIGGRPHITYQAIHAVPPRLLGAAFLASSQAVQNEAAATEDASKAPVPPKAKRAAKKAPAKKAASK